MFNLKKLAVTGAVVVASSSVAYAAGPDFSAMTTGVDFSTASTAIIAVGVAAAGMSVAIAGVRAVLRMIRGA
ncbi:TPA: hypothetical protein PWY77_002413 [Mannheimia haemolytica]|uniref:Phage-related membrane protein n=1 Tax=Mannheimia haemolytica TaxID=75985 RepID=A0A378NBE4_MANHA|nr:hypothetical protein [Mannheimia haemolytica]AGQ37746.1 hypothetical protein J450_00780 [Mannheimia haemolytica D171]KYL13432.1 hypothetical protein AC571_12510 [Mannheimia haemolytica]MDW1110172.1 hypothetical protein [Mannheimia haemolytica]MDW1112707.1 hypothetical protein [Mannheimia haemolytica]MDW1133120.1 hypothetical protein [Mannheimia haemolytica]